MKRHLVTKRSHSYSTFVLLSPDLSPGKYSLLGNMYVNIGACDTRFISTFLRHQYSSSKPAGPGRWRPWGAVGLPPRRPVPAARPPQAPADPQAKTKSPDAEESAHSEHQFQIKPWGRALRRQGRQRVQVQPRPEHGGRARAVGRRFKTCPRGAARPL